MESRSHKFTYGECTDKLMSQLTQPSATKEALLAQGLSDTDAITFLTRTLAGTFCDASAHGDAAQFMSEWHSTLRASCSDYYQALKAEHPNQTDEVINQDESLSRLNAIRRGVGMAMRQDYKEAWRWGTGAFIVTNMSIRNS